MESQNRMCRICLNSGSQQELTDIYSNNNEIALKIHLISGITIIELTEHNIPAMICQTCLKELYQCFLFRKKCHNAEEFFRTQTRRVESQLWKNEVATTPETSDFNSIKVEPIVELVPAGADEETNQSCFSFLPGDLEDVKFCVDSEDESFAGEVVIEEIIETEIPLKNVGFRRRSRKKPTESTAKCTRNSLECKYCGITLSRRNRLIQHERLHVLDQTQDFYICFFCGKTFNQKFGLLPHFKNFHNHSPGAKEKWKCAICVDKILPPGNLALHYEKEHSNFSFKCLGKNLKESSIKRDLSEKVARKRRTTKKQKPPVNFWPCSICGNSFSNYSRYQKHLKEIHEVNETQVIQDTAALRNSIAVDEDSMIKSNQGPKFPCSTCGKVFASMMTVRAHEKTHLNIEYKCDLCGSSFRVKAYLTAHVQKVHLKLKKFKCSIENCSASFVHRELLNYHVRKHLNIRNFACKYCGKTFVTNSCCKIHERIHTDERPYLCKFCDRTFIHHSDHRRHELKHNTNQKPLQTYDQFSVV